MDINEFEITKRENIIETDNLIPPDWYDESEGGYNYKFTLIEKGKNVTHPKEIYYGTAGSVLGYIDGSYYESCEDEDFRNNITDTECKWKFEVTKFCAFDGVKRYSFGLIILISSPYNALKRILNDSSVPLLL